MKRKEFKEVLRLRDVIVDSTHQIKEIFEQLHDDHGGFLSKREVEAGEVDPWNLGVSDLIMFIGKLERISNMISEDE